MKTWNVRFLGTSSAAQGEKQARLRSRQTWGVLASLLEAASQRDGGWLDRRVLIARFWADSDNGRVSLRMALASLRDAFGADCLECADERVRILAGRFCTDLAQIEEVWHRAQQTTELSERLNYLGEAESLLGGTLLDGCCVTPITFGADSETGWLETQRTLWSLRTAEIFLLLAETLEAVGSPHGALEAACRAAGFHPESQVISEAVWRLGRKTDRMPLALTLHTSLDFPEAVKRVREREQMSLPLPPREERAFRHLLQSRLQALSENLRTACFSLSVFPASFQEEQAFEVCSVRPGALRRLVEAQMLECQSERYETPSPLRRFLWSQVAAAAKRRLLTRQARFCRKWLARDVTAPEHAALCCAFANEKEAEQHLKQVMDLYQETPPTEAGIDFMIGLYSRPLPQFDPVCLNYCERAFRLTSLPISVRYRAGYYAGRIAASLLDFHLARSLLLAAAALPVPDIPSDVHAQIYFHLAHACHHAEYPTEAIQHIETAAALFSIEGKMESLRFKSEILRAQEDYTGALLALAEYKQALACCTHLPDRSLSQAEYLFHLGAVKRGMDDSEGAAAAWKAALVLRQEAGDDSSIADCLRSLAGLMSERGEGSEARIYLDHALLLYERAGNYGGKAASQQSIGDLLVRQGRTKAARQYYETALGYWQTLRHQAWITEVQNQLAALPAEAPGHTG